MFGTESDARLWARRHTWVVGLCALQALVLAGAIIVRHDAPLLAILAALTVAGPVVAWRLPHLPRGATASVSAATLVVQATLFIVVFGPHVRAHVVLLAILCVVGLYEVSAVFALTFAAIALIAEALAFIDPALVGLPPGDMELIYSTMLSGAIATGLGAVSLAVIWTEHRKMRHIAAEERRVSTAYLGVSGSIVIVMNAEGIVTVANRQACLVLDREEDDLVGREWFGIALPPEQQEQARAIYAQGFDPEVDIFQEYHDYENEIVGRDGERRAITWWGTMLFDRHDEPVGMVCAGTDVTDERAAKAALERNTLELASLRRLAQKVASLDDSRQAIVDAALEVSGATMAAISEPNRTRDTLTYTVCTDESVLGFEIDVTAGDSRLAEAFVGGHPQFMGDLANNQGLHKALSTAATQGRPGSALHQPIVGADGTLGVLSVAWDHTLESLQDRKALLIGLVAHEASIALRRRESLAQLERAALVDPLTGIANRRAFDAELPIAMRRAEEGGYPLALVMMDLNEFKAVNDVLGHEAGDDVLIRSAGAWADALRAGDLLARLGGDEFAVLLPTCDELEMAQIVKRLRAATPHRPGTSLGGSIWDGTETAASLIRRADAAQYVDKSRCRAGDRRRPAAHLTVSFGDAPARPRSEDPRAGNGAD